MPIIETKGGIRLHVHTDDKVGNPAIAAIAGKLVDSHPNIKHLIPQDNTSEEPVTDGFVVGDTPNDYSPPETGVHTVYRFHAGRAPERITDPLA